MKTKHLISLKDYSRDEIEEIFDLAAQVKADPLGLRRGAARASRWP